jgi:hypothetical protein
MPKIPTYPTILDHVKQISISKLKEWGYLEDHTFKSGTITWSQNGQELGSIRIRSNMKAKQPFIQLSYTYNKEEPVDYRVKLTSVPSNLGVGKLWYFVCPETGKRCRKLYGAGKNFLHREAFPDAMYESQTLSKHGRELNRYFSLYGSLDDLYEELYSKGFTTHYNGKPTKRYKQIMSQLEQVKKMKSELMQYLNV